MYAIVAITHFFGPSVSAPEILDNGFETAEEAWTALKSEDRSETMSHNQYNTTYYVIAEDDIPDCDLEGDMPDAEDDREACDFPYRRVADAVGLNSYLDENYEDPDHFENGDEVSVSDFDEGIKRYLNVCGDGECGYCHPHYLLDIADTIEKKAVRRLVVGVT